MPRKTRKKDIVKLLASMAGAKCNDAVKLLMLGQVDEEGLEGLDLSMVSEIKRTDKGGMEIKFFDRLEAVHLLWEVLSQVPDESQNQTGLIAAIVRATEQGK